MSYATDAQPKAVKSFLIFLMDELVILIQLGSVGALKEGWGLRE